MRSRPAWFYQQAGALPYRVLDDELELLLITSRSGRWIIPKGVIEPGATAAATACNEAYEEAGVIGAVSAQPLGAYQHKKWGGVCNVSVFSLHVATILETWPEAATRRRRWWPQSVAAQAVGRAQLRALILGLTPAKL
jgi:phosphohistidine phosphatase